MSIFKKESFYNIFLNEKMTQEEEKALKNVGR